MLQKYWASMVIFIVFFFVHDIHVTTTEKYFVLSIFQLQLIYDIKIMEMRLQFSQRG